MKLRAAIIGNGFFANTVHLPALASFAEVEIAGICAFNEERLKQTATKYHIPPEHIFLSRERNDYRRMVEKQAPDAVYVIGQPDQMYDIWVWCLQQGLSLYIEKPLGLTMHQADMLTELAEKHHCITQVSFQRRSAPLLQMAQLECLKKGPVTNAVVEFSKYDPQPMWGTRDRMLDDYTHCIDTARWVCGGEIIHIDAETRRLSMPDINWIGSTLYFDNGSSCFVLGNWTSGRRVFRVNIHAPGICCDVEIENKATIYKDGDYAGQEFDTRAVAGSDELYVYGGFRNKHREFIDSVLSRTELTSSAFRDARKTMEAAQYILAGELAGRFPGKP